MSALDDMIRRMRELGALPSTMAKEAAPLVLAEVQRTASAGTTPDGTPWKLKKDGSAPLTKAAEALSVKVLGTVVKLVLTGVNVVHNAGTGWLPKRRILPETGAALPAGVAKACKEGATRAFNRVMRAA